MNAPNTAATITGHRTVCISSGGKIIALMVTDLDTGDVSFREVNASVTMDNNSIVFKNLESEEFEITF